MSHDLPPSTDHETDPELTTLFATLKDDKPPPDIESRLLQGLATAAATGAGIAATKSSLWSKLFLWLATEGLPKSILLGALGGALVGGAITLATPPSDSLVAPSSPETLPASRPAGKDHAPAPSPNPNSPGAPPANSLSPVGTPTPVTTSPLGPSNGAPSNSAATAPPDSPSPVAPTPSDPAATGNDAATGSDAATAAAGTTSPPPSPLPPEPADALRREVPLVRAIATLVDAARCDEARAAIAAYRAEHHKGQLAAEVDALAVRCQPR